MLEVNVVAFAALPNKTEAKKIALASLFVCLFVCLFEHDALPLKLLK